MAWDAVLTSNKPTAPASRELMNDETIYLAGEGSWEALFPPPSYEEVYAFSPDTEGGVRTKSRPENKVGTGKVFIAGTQGEIVAGIAEWEQLLTEVHRYGGTFTYTPDAGTAVTYEVVSARLASMPQVPYLAGQIQESEFELTYKPFGLLDEVELVVDESSTEPLLEFDVPATGGSVDALGRLVLTEGSDQDREHVEYGLESRYYDPDAPWPLLIDSADMSALAGASATTRTGNYASGVLRQTLSGSSQGVGSVASTHVGRFRVKARLYASAAATATPVSARLGWSVRGGGVSFNDWATITSGGAFYELDLGVVSIPPPPIGSTHSVEFSVYGKATSGTPTLDLDYLKLFPAERYGKAKGLVGSVATLRADRYFRIRHDAAETETSTDVWTRHPGGEGSYLKIPPSGGRIAVAANRNDIDDEAHSSLGDELQASLFVTPRVALLGA